MAIGWIFWTKAESTQSIFKEKIFVLELNSSVRIPLTNSSHIQFSSVITTPNTKVIYCLPILVFFPQKTGTISLMISLENLFDLYWHSIISTFPGLFIICFYLQFFCVLCVVCNKTSFLGKLPVKKLRSIILFLRVKVLSSYLPCLFLSDFKEDTCLIIDQIGLWLDQYGS